LGVAFVEGGAVMVVEITGAKLLGPVYGSSLYVWSAVLALTLGGLAGGYFLGARLSRSTTARSALFGALALSAVWVAVMPWLAPLVMQATLGLELRLGVTLACLVFLVPPLVAFGTVSPMMIRLLAERLAGSGHASGTVYAVSTAGGILFTLVTAFWAIPVLGKQLTLLLTAAALALPALLYFARLAPRWTGAPA
ncbi:MAG: fused MFS/spermidine synthase, partial [Wenzhouxiangellaceae bacterium]